MKVLVKITTPPGEALRTSKRLNSMLMPRRVKYISWTNDADDQVFWEIEGQPRDILKVNKNVAYYDSIMRNVFETKTLQRQVHKLSEEDQKTLKEMLINQTTLEVIKVSKIEEKEVNEKLTWWDKVKEKFVRV